MAESSSSPVVLTRTSPVEGGGGVGVSGSEQRGQWGQRGQFAREDVPLRWKLGLVILVSAVGGSLVGMLEMRLNHAVWPLGVGLGAVVMPALWLAQRWIARPIEGFTSRLEELLGYRNPHSAEALHGLPTDRQDEIGKQARLVHQIALLGVRHHHEANNLRRTLDHRIAEATALATKKLRSIAMRDALTDLANRRFLDENLEPLVKSVRQSGSDLVCVILDMDNFKRVNDAHGHAIGDELLIFLAGLIRATTRHEDYAIRLGGDEFCVLMPACSLERAAEFTQRLGALFRQHMRSAFTGPVVPSLSIGVASLLRDQASDGQALLQKADANLYAAKGAGKGRAVGA